MSQLTVDDIIDIDKFVIEIDEDQADLDEAMRKQTSRTAYYGMLYAKSRTQADRIKMLLEACEAKVLTEVQEIASAEQERVTNDVLKARVAQDSRIVKLKRLKLQADEVKSICQVAYEAFKVRRDMLISRGNMAREEMRSHVRVSKTQDKVSEHRARRERIRRSATSDEAAG